MRNGTRGHGRAARGAHKFGLTPCAGGTPEWLPHCRRRRTELSDRTRESGLCRRPAARARRPDVSGKPFESFTAPEPYFESLKKLGGIIERIEAHKTFEDGDDVCVLYDMVTKSPAGTAFIAEWYRVKRGKIATVRAVFDARPFAAMFGQ